MIKAIDIMGVTKEFANILQVVHVLHIIAIRTIMGMWRMELFCGPNSAESADFLQIRQFMPPSFEEDAGAGDIL